MLLKILCLLFLQKLNAETIPFQEEACVQREGQCQLTHHSCSGQFVSNLCPKQPADVKCCVYEPRQDALCATLQGQCQNQYQRCSGRLLRGYCPSQPNFIKCCVNAARIPCINDSCIQEVTVPYRAKSANQSVSYLPTTVVQGHFGIPCHNGTVTSPNLVPLFVTTDLGPFRAYGMRPFLEALKRGFATLNNRNPHLYKRLTNGGTFNCRNIAGTNRYSNHAFGAALDVKLDGRYDPLGNGFTFDGLIEVFDVMRLEGIHWGAGWQREDAMHFEVGRQTFERWIQDGIV